MSYIKQQDAGGDCMTKLSLTLPSGNVFPVQGFFTNAAVAYVHSTVCTRIMRRLNVSPPISQQAI